MRQEWSIVFSSNKRRASSWKKPFLIYMLFACIYNETFEIQRRRRLSHTEMTHE
jgi:hypothetical protein